MGKGTGNGGRAGGGRIRVGDTIEPRAQLGTGAAFRSRVVSADRSGFTVERIGDKSGRQFFVPRDRAVKIG